MYTVALSFLKSYFSDIKNIVIALLVIFILSLNINIYFKNNKIKSLNNDIKVLNEKNIDLSFKLDKQNLAIKELNDNYNKSKEIFDKKYIELSKKQEPKLKQIEKQKEYKSPEGISELDASRKVLKDFIRSRK